MVVATCSGCGFHLRGYTLAENVGSYFIESSTDARMRGPLIQGLRLAGVESAANARAADVVIELIDGRRERRGVSVTGAARVAEYELAIELEYLVRDGGGTELLAAQTVRVERVYRLDANNIVGSNEEQTLLERELENDLVQQVIRALNAVTRPADETTESA